MTQNDRILARLRMGKLCSFEPLSWHPLISRTAARINDLKAEGFRITAHDCLIHNGSTPHHVVYELVTADQEALF